MEQDQKALHVPGQRQHVVLNLSWAPCESCEAAGPVRVRVVCRPWCLGFADIRRRGGPPASTMEDGRSRGRVGATAGVDVAAPRCLVSPWCKFRLGRVAKWGFAHFSSPHARAVHLIGTRHGSEHAPGCDDGHGHEEPRILTVQRKAASPTTKGVGVGRATQDRQGGLCGSWSQDAGEGRWRARPWMRGAGRRQGSVAAKARCAH